MSEAAPDARKRRRRQHAGIAALWLVAGILILGQWLLLRDVYEGIEASARGFRADLIVPSRRWVTWGVLVPLFLITAALFLQRRWTTGAFRRVARVGCLLLVPAYFFGLIGIELYGDNPIDSVTTRDGRRFVLALQPIWTDTVYSLYQSVGPLGIYWRRVGHLDYSEDGRFIGNESLVLSPDEHWLAVTRAGLWTDCFRLQRGRSIDCMTLTYPNWIDSDYERDMRRRSLEIAALTGMRPPADGDR